MSIFPYIKGMFTFISHHFFNITSIYLNFTARAITPDRNSDMSLYWKRNQTNKQKKPHTTHPIYSKFNYKMKSKVPLGKSTKLLEQTKKSIELVAKYILIEPFNKFCCQISCKLSSIFYRWFYLFDRE